MGAILILLVLSIFTSSGFSQLQSSETGYISVVISEKGLIFAKDLLIENAIQTLTALTLPDIHQSKKIPLIGSVSASLTNITVYHIDVPCSTIQPGESGIAIAASRATVDLSMNWEYSYSTWLIPIPISDKGTASVKVKGMEVGLTVNIQNQNGTLKLNLVQCGCYMEDITITLDGGASWFYQGFVNAFEGQIRSIVETAITKKITEGIVKLDSLLQTLPKKINVDKVASLNVTVVNGPLFGNSSVEVDINGLFIPSYDDAVIRYLNRNSQLSDFCDGKLKMLEISLDEDVFNSGSKAYFKAGLMHWLVDKVPDQSLLNTASWKYLIPKLYKQYPNDDMELNLTLSSPPVIKVTTKNIGVTIRSDMIVNVLDFGVAVPVACISVDISATGVPEISGNNLAGSAQLDDFTLKLKWSTVGNFHMSLIQGVMCVFLDTVFMPYVNLHLRKGFPLPIIHKLTLENAVIVTSTSKIIICSDVVSNSSKFMFPSF
ncbi:lipopolysaccharide-binding protein [Dioscorea alata]|uniref:Lipopolysaccharide-binding protein n=1 Tax=Dioscorea alata TaxID=55571 RepID=A0ACB7VIW4_DIOAL|nr:lipopolysaccharide-binding protein [Dioscorea alata]